MPRSDTSAGAQEKLITVVAVRFDIGSSRRQHSLAGGAGSDDVLKPLSLKMFAVRSRARFVLTVQCLVLTPARARKKS